MGWRIRGKGGTKETCYSRPNGTENYDELRVGGGELGRTTALQNIYCRSVTTF